MERTKNTKAIWAFCPRARSIYKTLGVAIVLGLFSFKMIPSKEELIKEKNEVIKNLKLDINKLTKTVQELKEIATKSIQKEKTTEQEAKELKEEIDFLKSALTKKRTSDPDVIRIERQLTSYDSVKIGKAMRKISPYDSLEIYRGYIQGHLAKSNGGVRPEKIRNGK